MSEEYKEQNMSQKIDKIMEAIESSNKKKMKLPRKARVNKRKIKQGYIGVLYIDENGNLRGDKVKVEGSAFREKSDVRYHATDGREILLWEGKFPVVIQPTWKKNPLTIRNSEGKNETYGQKYIMTMMLENAISLKKGGGMSILLIIALAVGGYLLYSAFV